MIKYLSVILALLVLVCFHGCEKIGFAQPTGISDSFAEIMESPDGYPQLTKEEFIEITNNYLSTGEWVLPIEKAFSYAYGVNYSTYIVDNDYLFSLYIMDNPDGSVVYDIYLAHYIDGVESERESDPLLFEEFMK